MIGSQFVLELVNAALYASSVVTLHDIRRLAIACSRGSLFFVTLRIIWHNFLRDIWHIDAYLNPTFGHGVFDQLRSLLRRLGTGSDSRCFVIKDATRLAPKELIHRHANPARMIHL